MIRQYIWRTAEIVQETQDTITIVFDTGTETFEYKAGQFINLTSLIDGAPVTRSYSLSSAPGVDPMPSITVKKVPGGIMSNYIVDNAKGIQHWRIDGPYGSFTYPEKSKHIVLLVAGSGVTPGFSIGKSVLYQLPDVKLTLLYANRRADNIIFRKQIEQWKNKYKERVHIVYSLSQPGDATAIAADEVIKGRLSKITVGKLIKRYVSDSLAEAHYFICGPAPLIKIQEESLSALTVPSENVFIEKFRPDDNPDPVELAQDMHEVMLHFYEQSNLLEVQPGDSILTAALQDQIALPYSCKTGTCGRCLARLTTGKVIMKQNYALGKEEQDAGMILLCQSYPTNDEVTVEIG